MLLRTIWLSLAPVHVLADARRESYAPPVAVGDVMVGATVGEVVASRHDDFAPGDLALGGGGWQEFAALDGASLRKVDRAWGPTSLCLNVLGGNGLTAYAGLLDIGRPKPGETVVVAAASGGVGSLVGQIARIKGARAVGIAGGRGEMRLRARRARLRCVSRSSRPELRGGPRRRLPERHRRLFRECRRAGLGGGAAAAQRFRAHPGVRPDRAIRRDRGAAGAEPGAGGDARRVEQAADLARLHLQRLRGDV